MFVSPVSGLALRREKTGIGLKSGHVQQATPLIIQFYNYVSLIISSNREPQSGFMLGIKRSLRDNPLNGLMLSGLPSRPL